MMLLDGPQYTDDRTLQAASTSSENDEWKAVLKQCPTTPPPLWTKGYWQNSGLLSNGCFFERRDQYVRRASWCILTQDVAEVLADFIKDRTVVELLAGTGYIAHHLRALSSLDRKQYRAYDSRGSHQFHDTTNYRGVTKKNARMAPIKSADIVLMTWPCYDDPLAAILIKKMVKGQYLIYNGEGYGGCTADDAFFDVLERDFVELEDLSEALDTRHIRWFGINDRWSIWQKIV